MSADSTSSSAPHPAIFGRLSIALAIALGGGLWSLGVYRQGINYDEALRAHSLWLTAQGERPYRDFFEVHPPYFRLLAWLAPAADEPTFEMLKLRAFAGVGNGVFLAALACLAARRAGGALAAAVVGFVACVGAADYLVEFRIDGWGWAATAVAVAVLDAGPRRLGWRTLGAAFLGGAAALLFNPKAALLLPCVAVAMQFGQRASVLVAVRQAAALVAIFALGVATPVAILAATGEDLRILFDSVYRFNATVNANSFHGLGLLKHVFTDRFGLPLLIASSVAAVVAARMRDSVLLGLGVWLAIQMAVVGSPYKQYAAPWLLWTTPLVALLAARCTRRLPGLAPLLGFAFAAAVALGAANWNSQDSFAKHAAIVRRLQEIVPPGEFVVGSMPSHPITRRDSFDLWWNTFDVNGRDSEWVFERMCWAEPRVSDAAYRRQLAERPPAVVVLAADDLPSFYPRRQQAALEAYLTDRRYRMVQRWGLLLAVRPDLAERIEASQK